ncbi:hypothetical protein [Ancylobacter defluvii]|uniref:Uncharacterized protein n=1 Tax=Ancylobacter defluvii TaxID=1282440 RepID=A0A9W6K292_9HYPH|nr:hypothetical protein [Ancylobacter defluvii]MBS7588288.1 hypothetical protein [Ancylobacter defluvii]GLK86684.1 hypothetical protein GCM10017653_47540 [Ancylobacter defluvii]
MATPSSKTRQSRSSTPYVKWIGGIITLIYAIFGIYHKSTGDVLFATSIATVGLFLVDPDVTKKIDRSISEYIIRFFRFYRHGNRLSRIFIIVIAFGGTALVFDSTYRLDIIYIDAIEIIIKRLAPLLVVLSVTFYMASYVSNFFYNLNVNISDQTARKYEILFYMSVTLFIVSNIIFWPGFPTESFWQNDTKDKDGNVVDQLVYGDWKDLSEGFFPALYAAMGFSGLWSTTCILLILSRYTERLWASPDHPNNTPAA